MSCEPEKAIISPRRKRLFSCILAVVLFICALYGVRPALAADGGAGPERIAGRPVLVFTTFPSDGMGVVFGNVLREAYCRMGYEVVIKRVPAERALVMSNSGAVDGEAGRVTVIEKSNPNLVRVPTPIYVSDVVAFVHKGRTMIDLDDGWDSLFRYRVGAVIGYKFVEKMTRNMNTEYVASYSTLFSMLDHARIDVAVSTYLEALPTIRELGLKNVEALQPPLASNPMYHYLNKKHDDLVPRIDTELRRMTEEGRISRIAQEVAEKYLIR